MRISILCLAVIALGACIPRVPTQRLETRAAAAVGIVFEGSDAATPDGFVKAIADELSVHNVEMAQVDGAAISVQKLTDARLLAVKNAKADGVISVLIEIRPHFFSQLDGRYRWEVATMLTVERKDGQRASDSFEVPIVLMFEHERGPDAVLAAAPDIATRLGRLIDSLLVGATGSKTTTTAVQRPNALYFAMVDRFANGDTSNDGTIGVVDPQAFHGGDLAGLLQHREWISSMGFDAVWISPVSKMRTEKWHGYGAFHGYWPYDINSIEPRFGSREVLRQLSADLHAHSGQLILDVVLNHVGPDAALLQEHPDWFHHNGGVTDWKSPQQLEDNDVKGLSDLAQENPEVYSYLLNATLQTLRASDADGLRLDAVKHAPLSFWSRFNLDIQRLSDRPRFLLGEFLDTDIEKLASVWKEGHFTSLFDFPLAFAMTDVFCKGAPVSKIAASLSNDRVYDDASLLVTLLDNHDLPRVASQCGGDETKIANALRFLTAMRGIPSIIWGTEIGMTGTKEPENRQSMRFIDGTLRSQLTDMLRLRRESPALSSGASVILSLDSTHLAVGRVSKEQVAVVCVNQDSTPWKPNLQHHWQHIVDSCAPGVTVHFAKVDLTDREVAAIYEQWHTGKQTRIVHFDAPVPGVRLVGSGPELGSWQPERSVALPADIALPVGAAFEFKWVRTTPGAAPEWDPEANRSILIEPGATPLNAKF